MKAFEQTQSTDTNDLFLSVVLVEMAQIAVAAENTRIQPDRFLEKSGMRMKKSRNI